MYQEPSHKNKLTRGPAKAATANCKLVPGPEIATNPGTKNMKPKPVNLEIIVRIPSIKVKVSR